jgi:hypothetical protein
MGNPDENTKYPNNRSTYYRIPDKIGLRKEHKTGISALLLIGWD